MIPAKIETHKRASHLHVWGRHTNTNADSKHRIIPSIVGEMTLMVVDDEDGLLHGNNDHKR